MFYVNNTNERQFFEKECYKCEWNLQCCGDEGEREREECCVDIGSVPEIGFG